MRCALAILACTTLSSALTAADPTYRDPQLQPFASNSIWNTPIGSGAVYSPANLAPSSNTWFGGDGETHVVVNAGDPWVDLRDPSNGSRWPGSTVRGTMQVPYNLYLRDVANGDTPNMCTSFLLPDRRTVAQLQPACRITPGAQIVGYRNRDVDIYGGGESGTHWGSGLSTLGGSIRLGELGNNQPLRHAIKVNLYAAQYYYYASDRLGYRWPADRADSYANGVYGGQNRKLCAGSLLAIPPNVTAASLNITKPVTIKYFNALRDYGAYVVDDTYWDAVCFCYEMGALEEAQAFFGESPQGQNNAVLDEFKRMFTALNVVDNNDATHIGGGGTPRQPLLPLLADPAYTVPGSVTAAGPAGAVVVRWTDPSNNEDGFEIHRRSGGGAWASVASPAANSTSWTDTAATGGTTWDYRVRLLKSPSASNWSATVSCLPAGGGGGNTAPTMSTVANQTITEDAATAALAVTVGDAETAASSLTFTGVATDTTLLPGSGITIGGTGANRTVTLTPAANRNGSTAVTLTVGDGTTTTSSTFTLNVTAVNDAPVNTVAPTMGGSPVQGAVLTATSGTWNDTIDGGTKITYAYAWSRATSAAGAGATVIATTQSYTPVAGDVGAYLRVTVTATDSGAPGTASAVASSGWVLATATVNTAPTISTVANQSIAEDAATAALAVTVGDTETAASALTFTAVAADTTLLPGSGITVGGSGANRTVTLTPAADRNGSTVVTLTVGDGTTTTSSTFTLTVTAVNDAPRLGTSLATVTGEVGIAVDVILPAGAFVDVDGDALTWAISSLPAGLTFDPTTRRLSGTPTTAGDTTVLVTARDPAGLPFTQSITVRVLSAGTTAGSGGSGSDAGQAPALTPTTSSSSNSCGLGGEVGILLMGALALIAGSRRRFR